MSFKVEVEVYGEEGRFHSNGMRFESEEQAKEYAIDLHSRWYAVKSWRVATSDEPATRKLDR